MYVYIYIYVAVRVFANQLGDLGSITGQVIPKDSKKWYLMPPCLTLSIIRYGIKGKVEQSRERSGRPSPTPWCSSCRKGSLRVHPRLWSPTSLFYICIYICMYIIYIYIYVCMQCMYVYIYVCIYAIYIYIYM